MAVFSAVTRIVVVGSVWTDAAHHYHLWKDKDGINHQFAEQLEWCIPGEIIKRKPEIVAIIGDCTLPRAGHIHKDGIEGWLPVGHHTKSRSPT